MSDAPSRTQLLRSPIVIGTVVIIVVAILAWAIFYWFPSGKKLSNLNAQESSLTSQQAVLNTKLAELKKTSQSQPQLLALQAELTQLVPTEPGIYPFINTLVAVTAQSGLTLTSITTQVTTAAPGSGYETIPITLLTTGSYDATLTFIKNIEDLPRLTIINAINVTGGGPGSSRTTTLGETFSLSIFAAAAPTTTTTPSTTTPSTSTTPTTG